MNLMQQRKLVRYIHLICTVFLGAFVYSAENREVAAFVLFNQAVVIPVLTATGLWMWQGQRIKSWFKKK